MKRIYTLFSVILALGCSNVVAQDGMSIGTNATPNEMLDVNGAIKIGSDFNGNTGAPIGGAGTIRWNAADERFEGWDGYTWVLLSSAGSDDQNLGTATLNTLTSILSIAIETGTGTTVDLSALEESADITAVQNNLDAHTAADNDLSVTNEIQDLSLSGNVLSLTADASTVDLSVFNNSGTDDQNLGTATLNPSTSVLSIAIETGTGTTADLSALEESAAIATVQNNLDTHTAADNDLSVTNEIQSLGSTVSGTDRTITISGGGNSTTISVADNDNSTANEIQTAAQVDVTPSGNLAADDVQEALLELQGDIDGIAPTIEDVLDNGDIAADGQNLEIDKVRARDADGLSLTDDASNGIFIEDGGNVGIGTLDPANRIHVKGQGIDVGPGSAENVIARFEQTTSSSGMGIQIMGYRAQAQASSFIDFSNTSEDFIPATEYSLARVAGINEDVSYQGALAFYTNPGTTVGGLTEKMRITSAGVVRVNSLAGSGNRLIQTDNTGHLSISPINPANVGTVTSVALSLPSILTVAGSPVTTSGTLSATLASQAANTVFAGPTSGSSAPTFRTLVAGDVPDLAASKITSGVLPIARGGTNSGAALNGNRVMVSNPAGTAIVENAALTANLPIYTNANGLPTTTAPTTGVQGFWTRNGSDVYPTNTADFIGIGNTNPVTDLHVDGLTYLFNNTAEDLRVGRNANEHLSVEVGDNHAYFDYEQDSDSNGSHIFYIRNNAAGTGENAIRFQTSAADRLTIADNGYVGVGITSPGQALDVAGNIRASGELISTNADQARFIYGNYGIIHRNDGSNYYMLLTASGDQYGSWNGLRPFRINNATGDVYIGGDAIYADHNNTVSLGSLTAGVVLSDASGTLSNVANLVGTGLGDNLGDHTATTNINANDRELQNLKAINGKDWDDNTGGTDNKYRLLFRDGAHQFYNGGVVVGNYGNGTWSDLADGTLIVEDRVGVGTTTPEAKLEVAGVALVQALMIQDIAWAPSPQGTGSDDEYHYVNCPDGYAMINFRVYHSDRTDGNAGANCINLSGILTGSNAYYGKNGSGTASGLDGSNDDTWHEGQCPDGYAATGMRVYANARWDRNLNLRCRPLIAGLTTTNDGNGVYSMWNRDWRGDGNYAQTECPPNTIVKSIRFYANDDSIDGNLRLYCTGIEPN